MVSIDFLILSTPFQEYPFSQKCNQVGGPTASEAAESLENNSLFFPCECLWAAVFPGWIKPEPPPPFQIFPQYHLWI